MLYTYQVYRWVKYVDKKCAAASRKHVQAIKQGKFIGDNTNLIGVDGDTALFEFANTKVLFHKVGVYRASQIGATAATTKKYLHDDKNMIMLSEKGVQFIEGVPFVRFGLWKAWYDEHGWFAGFLGASYFVTLGGVTHKIFILLYERLASLIN